jgi:hypothetical protein
MNGLAFGAAVVVLGFVLYFATSGLRGHPVQEAALPAAVQMD